MQQDRKHRRRVMRIVKLLLMVMRRLIEGCRCISSYTYIRRHACTYTYTRAAQKHRIQRSCDLPE